MYTKFTSKLAVLVGGSNIGMRLFAFNFYRVHKINDTEIIQHENKLAENFILNQFVVFLRKENILYVVKK